MRPEYSTLGGPGRQSLGDCVSTAARPSGSLLSKQKVKIVNASGQPMAPPSPVYSGVAPPTGVLLLVAYSHSSQVNVAGLKIVSSKLRLANGWAAAS